MALFNLERQRNDGRKGAEKQHNSVSRICPEVWDRCGTFTPMEAKPEPDWPDRGPLQVELMYNISSLPRSL